MSIRFNTEQPARLLSMFDQQVALGHGKGSIATWEKGEDGLYTHKKDPWARKAYFKASVYDVKLVFSIQWPKGGSYDPLIYGYYHGHIMDTFLTHFSDAFDSAFATAKPIPPSPPKKT